MTARPIVASPRSSTCSSSWRFSRWCSRWGRCGTWPVAARSCGWRQTPPRMARMAASCAWRRTCSRISDESGQSTVEAAVLLPVLMLLFALLVQPVCVCHTRMVMRHAAAETARVLATCTDERTVRNFALRRLKAVPEAAPFHVGGEGDWVVELARSSEGGTVEVRVCGHLEPLPFVGVVAELMGRRDGRGLLVEEGLAERVRPQWLGGDYGQWMQAW